MSRMAHELIKCIYEAGVGNTSKTSKEKSRMSKIAKSKVTRGNKPAQAGLKKIKQKEAI